MVALPRISRRHLGAAAMPLAYTVLTLLVFWRLWTPIEDASLTWKYDPIHEYWGDLVYQHDTLTRGQLALWNPHDRAGFPLYGDPQPGMLYPPNWLLLGWSALTGSVTHTVVEVKILGHWIFGAIGMHLFLRRRRAREPACYIGGTLFAFASPAIRYGGNALNWSYSWLGWVLLAVDWFADAPRTRRGIVLGTALAMPLLAGAPALFLTMLLLALPMGAYLLWGRIFASLRPLAVALGVAALWLAPLVVANLEQVPHSVREARNLGFITESVFAPSHLINLLVPRLGSENIYYGLLPLGCFVLLVASQRSAATALLVSAVVGILLAFGKHADVLPAVASALPPFTFFRRAHRYLYLTTAAVAAGCGLGVAYVLALDDPERQRTLARRAAWIGGAVTMVLAIAYVVAIVMAKESPAAKTDAFGLAAAAAAIGTWLLWALLASEGRRREILAWVAAVVVFVDVWTANAKVHDVGLGPRPRPNRDALVGELAGVAEGAFRIYDRGLLQYRAGTRLGVRDFGGYEDDPLGLARYDRFRNLVKRSLPLLGHANVRYYLDGGRQPPLHPKPTDGFRALRDGVYELPDVAPAVMYVPRARVVADIDAAFRALAEIVPGQGAVVEGAPPPAGAADALIVAGRITSLGPNRVVAEIEAPGPGLVVVAEAYYPAWRATRNGAPVTVQPANGLFRGVAVPAAGHYEIEMTLAPLRFWLLVPAPLGALALVGWVGVVWVRGLRSRRRTTSPPRSGTPPTADPPTV
jgi:hypothetical protein